MNHVKQGKLQYVILVPYLFEGVSGCMHMPNFTIIEPKTVSGRTAFSPYMLAQSLQTCVSVCFTEFVFCHLLQHRLGGSMMNHLTLSMQRAAGKLRSADCVAEGRVQVVVINKKDFMDLDNPLLAWMLDSDAVTTVLRVCMAVFSNPNLILAPFHLVFDLGHALCRHKPICIPLL